MNGSVIIVGNYEAPRQFGEEIIFKRVFQVWELFSHQEYLNKLRLLLLQAGGFFVLYSPGGVWGLVFFFGCNCIYFPLSC